MRRIQRTDPEWLDRPDRHLPYLRREVDQVVDGHTLVVERCRLCGKRLRGPRNLALDVGVGRNRTLFDGPDRLAGGPIEDEDEALLGDLRDRLDGSPVHDDVDEVGRGGQVVVPEPVVDDLEVPHPLARLEVERDQAFRKQIAPQTMTPIVIGGGRIEREIDVAEIRIDAHHRPHADLPRFTP